MGSPVSRRLCVADLTRPNGTARPLPIPPAWGAALAAQPCLGRPTRCCRWRAHQLGARSPRWGCLRPVRLGSLGAGSFGLQLPRTGVEGRSLFPAAPGVRRDRLMASERRANPGYDPTGAWMRLSSRADRRPASIGDGGSWAGGRTRRFTEECNGQFRDQTGWSFADALSKPTATPPSG